MSGIEVAALVLGVLPVVISALENYKAGQGLVASLMKWRGLLDTLIHRLQNARCVISLKLETLLMAAGVDGQALQNEQHLIRLLMDEKVVQKLQYYLRSSFDRFQSVLRTYERCLKLIATELVEIKRIPYVSQRSFLINFLRYINVYRLQMMICNR